MAEDPQRLPPGGSEQVVAGRALAVFVALAYALSWAWMAPFVLAGDVIEKGSGWPTHFLALLGPMVAAVVVTAWVSGRGGLADRLQPRQCHQGPAQGPDASQGCGCGCFSSVEAEAPDSELPLSGPGAAGFF